MLPICLVDVAVASSHMRKLCSKMGKSGDDGDTAESVVPQDPLTQAIAKQEELLRVMQQAHGEFHVSVSDDLAQLAMLCNMRGDHERALTLLHQRLVIHEKHGPPERMSETLHELGTTYRLRGVPDIALQHLERALATREQSHGATSFPVAETLNSLALLYHDLEETEKSEEFQQRSLRVLLAISDSEPEDIESQDIPWEVYKRLKQQRGPSTADNSIALFKGTMRQCVQDALAACHAAPEVDGTIAPLPLPSPPSLRSSLSLNDERESSTERSVAFFGAMPVSPCRPPASPPAPANSTTQAQSPVSAVIAGRIARSKSDSAMRLLRQERDPLDDLDGHVQTLNECGARSNSDRSLATADSSSRALRLSPAHAQPPLRRRTTPALLSPSTAGIASIQRHTQQPQQELAIRDAATLATRVETIKRRLVSGASAMDMEIAQFAADVERIPSATLELRLLGEAMVDLVREMDHMRRLGGVDRGGATAVALPVLEGHLEKKSASIFRGWERRFFKVDAKTWILSYHFSRDDCARGFAPRGGFPVARIAKIAMHGPRTSSSSSITSSSSSVAAGSGSGSGGSGGRWFPFDVVVDLSTRLNPHASRTYELRADSADARRHWVETLQLYRSMAQASAQSPL